MSFYIKLLIISPDPGIQIVSMSEDINYHHACNYKCLLTGMVLIINVYLEVLT